MKDIIFHIPKKISFAKNIVNSLPSYIRKKLPKEIAIIAVSPQESLKLNRRYRNKRKPANVLSFLYNTIPLSSPRKRGSRKSGFPIKSGMTEKKKNASLYGEIIVCPSVIAQEAKKQGNPQHLQMTWYILHGMLHLAGMHHERSRIMAKRVDRLEKKILAKLDISKNPIGI